VSGRATRIGIVGGTFDPIHAGHVAIAAGARDCAGLDRVLLVPARVPPHRSQPVASPADRFAMCRLAVDERPGLEVSDLELRRPGPSYTVDTLRELQAEVPEAQLYLVLGWDAAEAISTWYEPDEVLRLARLLVVPRLGWPIPTEDDLRRSGLDPARTVLCDLDAPEHVATEIRRHLADGGSLEGALDPDVLRYVRDHGLYAAEEA
jgi:nicotinate-nucleotide adenylyltransferase